MPVAEKMKEIPRVYLTSFWHMIGHDSYSDIPQALKDFNPFRTSV